MGSMEQFDDPRKGHEFAWGTYPSKSHGQVDGHKALQGLPFLVCEIFAALFDTEFCRKEATEASLEPEPFEGI